MKRLCATFCLLLLSAVCLTQDEPPFRHLIRSSRGMIPVGFHVGNCTEEGLGVAVGYQEYDHPAIPADLEGELFIPDSITEPHGRRLPMRWIARGAFQRCTGITEVHLPSTLYCISDLSFQDCKSLRQIVIPDSFHIFYPRAFIGCTGLRRIVLLSVKPPKSYNNDTFDEATYQTATIVFPAMSAEAYISNPLCYRFRYHAETIPLYHEQEERRHHQ